MGCASSGRLLTVSFGLSSFTVLYEVRIALLWALICCTFSLEYLLVIHLLTLFDRLVLPSKDEAIFDLMKGLLLRILEKKPRFNSLAWFSRIPIVISIPAIFNRLIPSPL